MFVDQPAVDSSIDRTAVSDARAEHLGDVLVQRAAESDVRNLQSATNRQHGQLQLERRLDEREFVVIAPRGRNFRTRVRRGTVARRIDVVAAREDEAVQAREVGGDARDVGHQTHRLAARLPDGLLVLGNIVIRIGGDADARRAAGRRNLVHAQVVRFAIGIRPHASR